MTVRVLQLCHGYGPPFDDVARQWLALFQGTGIEMTTVFMTGEPAPAVAERLPGEVVFLGNDSRRLRGMKWRVARQVRRLVANRDFSLVIAHRYKSLYVATLLGGIPVIGVHHAFGAYKRWGRRLWVRLWRKRLVLAAVSDAVRDEIRADLGGFPAERIVTVYNHIDPVATAAERLSRDRARKALGIADNDYVFATVGRLHPDKDQATLIRAFARVAPDMPRARLFIVGSGRLETSLKALVRELGVEDRVVFTGQLPAAARYFEAFDCFVLSSDHEPFGMVLLEAMSAGLPALCSDCGGGPEVVSRCDKLFPLGDSEALAGQMVSVYKLDTASLQQWNHENRNRVQECFSDAAVRESFWQAGFWGHLRWQGRGEVLS